MDDNTEHRMDGSKSAARPRAVGVKRLRAEQEGSGE
jgi:hypothetical protein